MATVAASLTQYIQGLGIATLDQDLFIGKAPSSNEVPDKIFWLVENGGNPVKKNKTGEVMKIYSVLINARDRDYKRLSENMLTLEENLNCSSCTQLAGFDTVDIEASSFPIDDDLDGEDRKIGVLQATITTYKEC